MNLKNIIKLLIIFIPFFFLSCQKLDNFRNKDEKIILTVKDEIENIEIFNNISKIHEGNFLDYYSKSVNFLWKNEKDLKKELTINNSPTKYPNSPSLKVSVINDKIYNLNHNSDLIIYNLNEKKNIEKYHISMSSDSEFSYPTSVAMLNNFLYAGYAEGTLIKFDLSGNIIWQLELNDILKTPIKIHNENLIVLLSNKIISIDTINENIDWEFIYNSENSLNIYGGNIVSKNHLLYFYLPNGRIGAIDTIIGENIDTLFSDIKFDHLIEKDKIENAISYKFINNALIVLNNEKNIKAHNIKNKKIFWQSDLNEYLDKDEKIIEIINNENRIIIFFNNGLILEIDLISGEVLFDQKLKLKEIISIYFINNYVFLSQINGKTAIFKQ